MEVCSRHLRFEHDAGHGSMPVHLYRVVQDDDALIVAPLPGVQAPRGDDGQACVLLTPLGLLELFRAPLHAIAGRALPLAAWDAASAAAPMREPSPQRLARWIAARIVERPPLAGAAARVARAATAIVEGASIDIDALAGAEGVTRRQLERGFRHWLGVSPMAYARRVRFERAAASLAAGLPIVDAAIDHGYADQAHLTRTFGAFARTTPRRFALRAAAPQPS